MKTHYKLNCGKLIPLDAADGWIKCYDCNLRGFSKRVRKDASFRNIITTGLTLEYKYIVIIYWLDNDLVKVIYDYSNIPITDKLSIDKAYEKV